MGFQDEARRLAAQEAEREFRKLVANVGQLLVDMREVKERLDRLEAERGQSPEPESPATL